MVLQQHGREMCSSAAVGLVRRNGASMHQVSIHLPVSQVQLKPASWDGAFVENVECKATYYNKHGHAV